MGAEISRSGSFPLISERCLRTDGGRLFSGTWYGGLKPAFRGWGAVGWLEAGRLILFCGHNRTSGWFLPVREWRLGAEISCSRLFPLISERWLRSGRGRLLAEAWYGDGFETRHYMPGTRLGGCRPWG